MSLLTHCINNKQGINKIYQFNPEYSKVLVVLFHCNITVSLQQLLVAILQV